MLDVATGERTILAEVPGFSHLDVGGGRLVYHVGRVLRWARVEEPGQSEVLALDLPAGVTPQRVRVSPDGSRLVFVAQGAGAGLYVVRLDDGGVRRLAGAPRAYPWVHGFDASGRYCLDADRRVWDLDTGAMTVAVGDDPTANGGVVTDRWVVLAQDGVVSVHPRRGGRPVVTWALHAPLSRLGSCLCADERGTLWLGNTGGFVRCLRLADG